MVVLDTNIVSAAMDRDHDVLDRLAALDPGEIVLCSPVSAEIRYGLERLAEGSRRRSLLQQEYELLRKAVRWVDWSEAATREFGRQKAQLERRGTPLEDFDIIIGTTAVTLDAALATRNTRHMARIEGLVILDWS